MKDSLYVLIGDGTNMDADRQGEIFCRLVSIAKVIFNKPDFNVYTNISEDMHDTIETIYHDDIWHYAKQLEMVAQSNYFIYCGDMSNVPIFKTIKNMIDDHDNPHIFRVSSLYL